jgi:hypothetical protein
MKPRYGTTDEEMLYFFLVRVSPRFFGTNERPNAGGVPRMYGKKDGAFPFMTGQAAGSIDVAP